MKSRLRPRHILKAAGAALFAGFVNLLLFGSLALYTSRSPKIDRSQLVERVPIEVIKRRRRVSLPSRKQESAGRRTKVREVRKRLPVPPRRVQAFRYEVTPLPLPDFSEASSVEVASLVPESFGVFEAAAVPLLQPGSASGAESNRGNGGGGGQRRVFSLGEVDEGPVRLLCPRPVYPPSARRRGLTGRVVVTFTVNERGEVKDPEVVESQGGSLFERSVLSVLGSWRFKPARKGNRPVAVRCRITFTFRLKEL